MRINGIGAVKKEEAMKILTAEGRRAVKAGEISTEELGEMYKLKWSKEPARSAETQSFSGSTITGFQRASRTN